MQNPPLDQPRIVPPRIKERAELAELKGLANALNMTAWALEVAISAENKAGVYRVGLHDKLPDAKFEEAYKTVSRINGVLADAVAELIEDGTLSYPWPELIRPFEVWRAAGYPNSQFDIEAEPE